MSLLKHRERPIETRDWMVPRLPAWPWFEDLFRETDGAQLIKVEEFSEDGTLVVRAELPGIDPDKDVEVTVEGGVLHITATRTEEEEKAERDFHRRELRYGSFARSIELPDGVDESAVSATYTGGILEVRVPMPEPPAKEPAHRITVGHG